MVFVLFFRFLLMFFGFLDLLFIFRCDACEFSDNVTDGTSCTFGFKKALYALTVLIGLFMTGLDVTEATILDVFCMYWVRGI